MTNLDDFDRSLAEFLADGPASAPEAPVIAALAHARTTPRRPDPLGALRADPMAPRRNGIAARPGLVLAALAIGVAVVGVAVVGSRPAEHSVLPVPSASVHGLPSPTSPAATSRPTFSSQIQLRVAAGSPVTLSVSDTTGALVGVESGNPADGATLDPGVVGVASDPANPDVLVAIWVGSPCEGISAMDVDERTATITIRRPQCTGDAVSFDRLARLTFDSPVDVGAWHGTSVMVPGPDASPSSSSATSSHVDLLSTTDHPASVDIVDESGRLVSAISGPLVGGRSVEFITATNAGSRTVRLSWPGLVCDTVHRLTIAPDLGLTIDRPQCEVSVDATEWSLLLTFNGPVDAATLDTALFSGRAGSGFPTWTIAGTDSNGGRFDLGVDDPPGLIVNVAGLDPLGASRPASGARLDQRGQAIVELIWIGRACDTEPRLSIDATGSRWTLAAATCDSRSPDVVRRVSLKLGAARSVDSITMIGSAAP